MHHSTGRLEALTRILGSDTACRAMSLGSRTSLGGLGALLRKIEINLVGGVGVDTVQKADVADSMKGDTHSNLQLGGGKVDSRDHFGSGAPPGDGG